MPPLKAKASIGKTIKVTCRGANLADLDDLIPFQGSLKSLSPENAQKLRKSILKNGVSFPFFIWPHRKKLYTLDGHQRERILYKLREEGYKIPRLPIDYIDAKDEKEAKEKILLLSSQYGEMTGESLEEFSQDIDLESLIPMVDLPGIDIELLLAEIKEFDPAPNSVKQNLDRMDQIAARKKENAALSEERDTEKFLALVFETREQKNQLLKELGLPPDERYLMAKSVTISRQKGPALLKSKSGRAIKSAPIRKAGATG